MSLDRVIKTAQKCPKRPFSATKCLHRHVSPPHNASVRRPPHTAKRSGARLRGPMPRCGGASDAPRPGATAKVRSALPACRARAPARIARAAALVWFEQRSCEGPHWNYKLYKYLCKFDEQITLESTIYYINMLITIDPPMNR